MTRQKPISVAIVGGGIGGLCLAIGLQRLAHIDVAIYEAAPEFKEISAGIALGPNAQRALEKISPEAAQGFRDIATSNSSPEFQNTWFEFRNGIRGPHEGVFLSKCQNETGQQNVYRAKFLNVLAALVSPSIAHFGKRLIAMEDKEDGVRIQFADGTTAEADCVIGADGVHSRIRKHLLGAENPAASAVFSGIVSYRGLIPMETARDSIGKFSEDAYMWCGDGGMVMTYPIDFGETLNVVASMSGKSSWDEDRYVVSATKSKLMKDFEGWGSIPTKVLEVSKKTLVSCDSRLMGNR
jgi:salicylate hydroxylase